MAIGIQNGAQKSQDIGKIMAPTTPLMNGRNDALERHGTS